MINNLKPYPAMKGSGVESLGDVPEHWEIHQLGRVGHLFKGVGGTKEDEVPSGVPCVRYGDLYMQHQYFIRESRSRVSEQRAVDYTPIHYGDVLFAGSGETIEEIGKSAVNLISGHACCGGDVIIFRSQIEIDASFLGYVTDCPQAAHQKSCMGRGITVMHIYGDELKYMWVARPPLPEQAAIVRYLDHADRRIRRYIRAKQKLITLLEEQKQAIIHQAVTRGLDPNVRIKPSGVELRRDRPERQWKPIKIKYLSSLKGRLGWQGLKASEYTSEGPYVVSSAHFRDHRINWEICPHVTRERYEMDENIQLAQGDILLMKDGAAMGKLAFVDELPGLACLNSHLLLFRPLVNDQGPTYFPQFMFFYMQVECFQGYVQIRYRPLSGRYDEGPPRGPIRASFLPAFWPSQSTCRFRPMTWTPSDTTDAIQSVVGLALSFANDGLLQFARGGSLMETVYQNCTTGRSNLFESHRQRRWLTVVS